MNYELSLEYYQGPFDKLLELIEEKKIEINCLSLAAVTADFLDYLEKTEKEGRMIAVILADFLTVASQLLLLKSKSLLPDLDINEQEEQQIQDLESRLKIYQEIKRVQINVKNQWQELPQLLSREFLMTSGPIFYPPKIKPVDLSLVVAKIVQEIERVFRPQTAVKIDVVNLKSKIEEILKKLTNMPKDLKEIALEKTRSELIALFLAVLHLIKEQLVVVEQKNNFSEITVAKIN